MPARSKPMGTLEWTRETSGLLNRRERSRLVGQALCFQMAALPEQLAGRLHLPQRHRTTLGLEELAPPDTALTREAQARSAALPDYLAEHSHRTYLWAAALAVLDDLDCDREALYVAALLHDIGLASRPTRPECFTLTGARHATEAASAADDRFGRGTIAAEAIVLHLNPIVKTRLGIEAHLLAAGAALDVVGRHHRRLHPATVDAVLERHPRQRFKTSFRRAWRDEARAVRGGRAATLHRLGFGLSVRMSPFEE